MIIFTEYADTKRYLVELLSAAIAHTIDGERRILQFHGGMGDDARDEVQRGGVVEIGLRLVGAMPSPRQERQERTRRARWNPSPRRSKRSTGGQEIRPSFALARGPFTSDDPFTTFDATPPVTVVVPAVGPAPKPWFALIWDLTETGAQIDLDARGATTRLVRGAAYQDWLRVIFPGDRGVRGNCDLSAFFFRRAAVLLGEHGCSGSTGRYLPREDHVPDRKSEHGRNGHGHGLFRTVAVADSHRVPISGFLAGRCFISSANFTQRGQERNIEVGVLIEDASFASYLAGQWLGLAEAGIVGESLG